MGKNLANRVVLLKKEIKLISLRDDDFIIDVASYGERQLENSTASLMGNINTGFNNDYFFDNIKFS